jgi:hypothetical protein
MAGFEEMRKKGIAAAKAKHPEYFTPALDAQGMVVVKPEPEDLDNPPRMLAPEPSIGEKVVKDLDFAPAGPSGQRVPLDDTSEGGMRKANAAAQATTLWDRATQLAEAELGADMSADPRPPTTIYDPEKFGAARARHYRTLMRDLLGEK